MLDCKTASTIAINMVHSKLDYCNADAPIHNLGVTFHPHLSFSNHISNFSHSCFMHIRNGHDLHLIDPCSTVKLPPPLLPTWSTQSLITAMPMPLFTILVLLFILISLSLTTYSTSRTPALCTFVTVMTSASSIHARL